MYRLAQLSGGSNHFRSKENCILYPKNVEAIGENQVEIRKFYFFFWGENNASYSVWIFYLPVARHAYYSSSSCCPSFSFEENLGVYIP
jgi:hypothetical protein